MSLILWTDGADGILSRFLNLVKTSGPRAISVPNRERFGVTLLEVRSSPGSGRIFLGELEWEGLD